MTVYVAILLGYASSFLFRKRIPTSSYPFFAFSFCLAFAYYGLSILVMGTFTLSAQANADPLDDTTAWAMHHIVGFLFGGAVSFLTLSRRAIFNKDSVLFNVLTLPVSNVVYLLIKGPKDSAPRFTLNSFNGATFVALIVALPFIKPIAEDAEISARFQAQNYMRVQYLEKLAANLVANTEFPLSFDEDGFLMLTGVSSNGRDIVVTVQESETELLDWDYEGMWEWFQTMTCHQSERLNAIENLAYPLTINLMVLDFEGLTQAENRSTHPYCD